MFNSYDLDDTIAAQATAGEPGYERGIIRLSGPETCSILSRSFRSGPPLDQIKSAQIVRGELSCSSLSLPVPVELLYWPTTRSYTRQVSAEIHTVGSQPILSAVLEQLCRDGARLAGPGEFTLRAFLSGRMDLTSAEAVLGVIDARNKKQLNVALDQLAGGIAKPLESIRSELISTLANLEAGLDFVEEDIEFVSQAQLWEMVQRGIDEIESLRDQIRSRNDLESTCRVVLCGRPNTGKSSLFNALVKQYGDSNRQSIVSGISGTTRDFISAPISIRGSELTLIDTAGLDEGWEPATDLQQTRIQTALSVGQDKGMAQQTNADLEIFCIDPADPLTTWENTKLNTPEPTRIVSVNKSDVHSRSSVDTQCATVCTSAKTGVGISELADLIYRSISDSGESVIGTAVRCVESVELALTALQNAQRWIEQEVGDEFVASEIRIALDAIGKITGKIYTDDILDVVFGQFCIGK